MELIILAAGRGKRINTHIKKNKCLLKINNQTLIEKIIKDFSSVIKLKKITVVVGYNHEKIKSNLINYNINFIYNKDYKTKEMLYSLYLGLLRSKENVIVSYSDIYFSKSIIKKLKKYSSNKIILPINSNWKSVWRKRGKNFFEDCESLKYDKNLLLKEIGNKIKSTSNVMGQYMGIIYFPKKIKKEIIKNYKKKLSNKKIHITRFLNELIKKKFKIKCLPCRSEWFEFDDIQDVKNFKI